MTDTDAPTPRPGQRSETIRHRNLATLLSELHLRGHQTRSDLVRRTGLSRTAVGSLVGDLVDLGYVAEQFATPTSRPGRPSPMVGPAVDGSITIGADLMVDSIGVTAVGLGGAVLATDRQPRSASTPEATIEQLRRQIDQLVAPLPAEIAAIGVAVPGLVDAVDRSLVRAPNLGWHDLPLGDLLDDALRPPVTTIVANEATAGAIAESRRGAGTIDRLVVHLSCEVGVGCGIVADGRPFQGAHGMAGEIGHLPVRPGGRRCRCGSTGCLETEIGEEAVLDRFALAGAATGDEVAAALLAADRFDRADQARWIAVAVASIVHLVDPDVIALGGLLGRVLPVLDDAIDRELDTMLPTAQLARVRIVPSALGPDAPMRGAAELAWDDLVARVGDGSRVPVAVSPR